MRNIKNIPPSDSISAQASSILTAAMPCLANRGWFPDNGAALATKLFLTAVGPRSASVYMVDPGPQSASFNMTALYESEGRNQLDNHWLQIPKTADAESVGHAIQKFCKGIDFSVSQTYAAKLYASRQLMANGGNVLERESEVPGPSA